MNSTALAGQAIFKPVNELSRKVGAGQARVTMAKGSSGSIW
jgi:light-harvesting complex II chlorophyll a/b binding protein 1/light-harvesting complex II chlorophyll a/b binding protein 2